MSITNPFTERGKITDPQRFAGRWAELSLLFGSLEARRPVFIVGTPGIGKSSLLTHVIQSAAINMERFDLRAFSLDLAAAHAEADVYRVVIEALGQQGNSLVALQDVLSTADAPTLLCLDNAHVVLGSEWGADMLDALVRLARMGLLMLVVAQNGEPPVLSERVVVVRLGAFAQAEVRLVAEAYLEGTGVSFTQRNLRQIYRLSRGHPAYLQRAAFHLFESKIRPGYDWVKAYLEEAKEQPIPGAPLPPQVFEGAAAEAQMAEEGEDEGFDAPPAPPTFEVDVPSGALFFLLPAALALMVLLLAGQIWLACAVVVVGLVVWALVRRFAGRGLRAGGSKGE